MKHLSVVLLILLTAPFAFAAKNSLRETPVVLAVKQAAPAVVNISTEVVTRTESPFQGDPFFDKFFRDFFGEGQTRERRGTSLGSGVVVDSAGHVLTNEHVVRNASKITVTLVNGDTREAKLVGADARTDLAVLKVSGGKLPYVELGRSGDLMIGETVIAIGNPFGLSHTVTTGVVSAVNRSIKGGDGRTYSDFIQTDASINPGNSGGPLLNIEGELIGINAAIYQSAEGIGFAIPIDKAKRIMNDLVTFGEVHRAYLGLQVQEVDEGLADYYNLAKPEGVLVRKVFSDSPADAAGVKRGDLVTSVDGSPVRDRADFFDRLAGFTAGSRIRLSLKASGREREVTLTATEAPKGYGREIARDWLGVGVETNTEKLAKKYGAASSKGVMVTDVSRGSAADKTGLQAGDVIRQVNDTDVADEKEFYKLMEAAGQRETVVLVVQRGRVAYHVSISP
jgi:serine protease Do